MTYVGVIQGEPKLDTEENIEYKWATLDEIRALPEMDIYFKELLGKNLIV
ncbi:hypothetical protein HY625_01790 [Candidatus Uhrbacteria bacterium]|nr:hypothetical protein [Candidatus Uhrbacteria bacterium]